jgi:hypothetical protein
MAVSAPTFIQPLAGDETANGKFVVVDLTFDSSYPTGGEAFDVAQLGLSEVWFAVIDATAPSATSYQFRYDKVNGKIQAYWVDTSVDGAALAEVADTTDLSTVTVRALFYGLSS